MTNPNPICTAIDIKREFRYWTSQHSLALVLEAIADEIEVMGVKYNSQPFAPWNLIARQMRMVSDLAVRFDFDEKI